MQGAELVAVGVAQIGDVEFDPTAFADARRFFAGFAAMGEAGGVERLGRLGRVGGKTDGAAIGKGCRLAIDRLRYREGPGLWGGENAVTVHPARWHAERTQQRVIE